ncbi:unnamed protein product [Lactuca saligna]|uniref:Uncharacterized protein n=1 Tax=Lactuca saligna TaxID=75948 RepID=A0AA36E612_LACSI|nr:unnamed protein product [Lactuca saligna]
MLRRLPRWWRGYPPLKPSLRSSQLQLQTPPHRTHQHIKFRLFVQLHLSGRRRSRSNVTTLDKRILPLQKTLWLDETAMEPSRMPLYRFGNTSVVIDIYLIMDWNFLHLLTIRR